ncbi:MAG: hypothetical protein PUA94_05290 [Bacteroidales bacterium]|nr:hypothetical protein [Bacteroidales bacterium]
MATVIFKWNPSFSSYTMNRFLIDLSYCKTDGNDYMDFNWSVWDYDKIHDEDELYWIKVGLGQIGIVGHGTITSDPYEDEDWSGKGRETFYVNFEPDILINPDALTLLTCKELSEAIPDFEWDKGHSGLVLNDRQAEKLRYLWVDYLDSHKKEFLRESIKDNDIIYLQQDLEKIASEIAARAHYGQKDKAGKDYIEHPQRVADKCDNPKERIVALLHDTIEDSDITPEYLADTGFPEEIIEAILSVTKREGEAYEDFVRRAAQNPIGRQVKLHDLEDNLDIMRLEELTEKDLVRINKYIRAYRYLSSL